MKNLGIYESFMFQRKPTKSGRKLTPIETRRAVWDFWHNNSTTSTITSRPAKLKLSDKPKIQNGLSFMDSVTLIEQRHRTFCQSIWMITTLTLKELYQKYLVKHSDMPVSWGTFLALKPFYVRSATTKDIEVCCCKKHLHARWAIQALISCAEKQKIDLGSITSYQSFFEYLTEKCQKEESSYISWECTTNKNSLCSEIRERWQNLKSHIMDGDDDVTTVNM